MDTSEVWNLNEMFYVLVCVGYQEKWRACNRCCLYTARQHRPV